MLSADPLTPVSSVAARPLIVRELGTIGYADCWALQNELAASVRSGASPDTLLVLEHPHTYTCGRRGGRAHILLPDEELAAREIAVLDVDRGGDVTYHGPGQMVGYPIINLHAYGQQIDYPAYIRALEVVLIDTLADFSIDAYRIPGYSGVWVGADGPEKIAAIGVRVDGHGITTHGVALNVSTDLTYFDGIVPCGIRGRGVTSMYKVLSTAPAMTEVHAHFVTHFSRVFCFEAA